MELEKGQIWRKHGPCDWIKINKILMPGFLEYDGGSPGLSVFFTNINGNWERNSKFMLFSSKKDFFKHMKDTGRELFNPPPNRALSSLTEVKEIRL